MLYLFYAYILKSQSSVVSMDDLAYDETYESSSERIETMDFLECFQPLRC